MRAVIFDLDGVLIDSEGLQYRAYSHVLASFGVSVSREAYARAKPEPDAYLATARRLGVSAAACVVVEDSHRGIVAAHRAGAAAIAVPNAFTRQQDFALAAAVVDSLDAVHLGLIER